MTSIEHRTRAVYDSLSPAEKKVAAYFLGHVENVFHMPIAALAEAAQIEVIPTLVLYRDGKAVDSIVNPGSKAAIDQFIQEAMAK